ncbi:MAG: hypothetical protein ACLP4V_23770 [Methylocella sp.]
MDGSYGELKATVEEGANNNCAATTHSTCRRAPLVRAPNARCAEIRELAGERWPEFSDQAPTLYAVWGGGATPQQAIYMIGLILPPRAAA